MKKAYMFAVAFLFLYLSTGALRGDDYVIQWADTVDNGDWDGASCIAVDSNNNIIVAGCSSLGGNNDYLLVKYDSGGTVLWQDTIDNGGVDHAEDVAVDHSNNIIVTGYSMIGGDYDYFTVKYNPEGTVLWRDTLDNGGMYDIARGIAVDDANNIMVTGYCDIGGDCVYVTVEYDPSGLIIWADTLDYGPYDSAFGVAVDDANNIIVTGYTSDGVNNDYFTVKYDSGGTILWQRVVDIYEFDQAYGVTVDNSNNVVVTGCTGGPLDDYDYFTVKYDPGGMIIWSDTLDRGNNDDVAYDIAVDNSSNAYITGYSLELAGDYDYYTVKYSPSGTILWQDALDNGDDDIAYGIAVDGGGNVIVTGRSYIGDDYDFLTVKYAPVQGVTQDESDTKPDGVRCHVFPNPFSNSASIELGIGDERLRVEDTSLQIFDVSGRCVRVLKYSMPHAPCAMQVIWDGSDDLGNVLPGGVYFLMYGIEEYRGIEKLLLVR